ncbi:MAG: potassium transporter KtrB [Hyphomonas sp.]|uniref:TrkH family potassium uptake protein n=1 Tax=Hyphomonas sp. TaxID=87 RepID=UPI00180786BC|nr:potassium transporter TrkG [Hyphomonas sp.]MBA3068148.1 potassium transporter KtrB [Hyphomonas sp.]MBU3921698.1 potassium transporter KtrB [Alphaproteobacteria bacterium]MBU4061117.1 potassium transporter KtrB [Alphaproteobacteria bacterium]MBU4162841.1 potassium transporter KtrB [Alphaproteobacteria bacterium]
MRSLRMIGALRKSLAVASLYAHRIMRRVHPTKLILAGYAFYMLLGWCFLCLPVAQAVPVNPLDNLFTAVSAVSTTGLVTVDPGTSYTFFGELVILLLIQAGGIGYMTLGSFIMLATVKHLSPLRERLTRTAFTLPENIITGHFIRAVVVFTLAIEVIGAVILYILFANAGVKDAPWSAIFHSVSAFCTAGFSLNPNSLENFRGDFAVNAAVSMLSILGAMGFLIVWDVWCSLTTRAFTLSFTSQIILRLTAGFLAFGTAVLFVADPGIAALPSSERLLSAFFQTMTAMTTVGFDTHPIGTLAPAAIVFLYLLMAIGAAPSGTGGGLKLTTFAALVGLVRSTVRRRKDVVFFGRVIPDERVRLASASAAYFVMLMTPAVFALTLTEPGKDFEMVLFEAFSAIGTVGLSMGITGSLSEIGKAIIILLMFAGRVGILTFGIALASREAEPAERHEGDLLV